MISKTHTATSSKVDMLHRYTGVITFANGQEVYLDSFYKSETAARNAVIRARAKLTAEGKSVATIRTVIMGIRFTGWSAPIRRGTYPTDFSGSRDGWLSDFLK